MDSPPAPVSPSTSPSTSPTASEPATVSDGPAEAPTGGASDAATFRVSAVGGSVAAFVAAAALLM
jgi:hypothetical protein